MSERDERDGRGSPAPVGRPHGALPPAEAPEPAVRPTVERARALADGSERSLDPRHVIVTRIGSAIGAGILAVLVLVASGVLMGVGPMPSPFNGMVAGALAIVAVLRLFFAWFWPPVAHRHASWRLDGDGIRIRRGVFWRHEVLVPRSRVQHTDVSRGPLERSFDLATLVVFTAGTEHSRVDLEGLAQEDAFAARDYLLDETGHHGR